MIPSQYRSLSLGSTNLLPAVSDTGLFKSGGMDTSESLSFKFDKPGTYHYTCSIHPRMVGTIIVQ
jgi:plastocyanin